MRYLDFEVKWCSNVIGTGHSITPCPFLRKEVVGSNACVRCKFCIYRDITSQKVRCKYPIYAKEVHK